MKIRKDLWNRLYVGYCVQSADTVKCSAGGSGNQSGPRAKQIITTHTNCCYFLFRLQPPPPPPTPSPPPHRLLSCDQLGRKLKLYSSRYKIYRFINFERALFQPSRHEPSTFLCYNVASCNKALHFLSVLTSFWVAGKNTVTLLELKLSECSKLLCLSFILYAIKFSEVVHLSTVILVSFLVRSRSLRKDLYKREGVFFASSWIIPPEENCSGKDAIKQVHRLFCNVQ